MSAEAKPDLYQGLRLTGGLIAAAIGAAVIVGIFAVFRFADGERERDLRTWQIRLGIVADSRAAAVDEWIDNQRRTVADLAANSSLRLYMTQIALGDDTGAADAAGQAEYLRNLLIATASRTGFEAPLLGPQVAANVERTGTAGLALSDGRGRVLVATPAMPAVDRPFVETLRRHDGSDVNIGDLYEGAAGHPSMAFLAPVFGIQDEPGEAEAIGFVIGVRLVGGDLFARLEQPGDVDDSAETYLVRSEGATVHYLSPLADGTPAMELSLAQDTPDLAAAFAVATPGGFGQRINYRNQKVLVTGRDLGTTAWTLVRTIIAGEALGQSEVRRDTMLVVLLLVIFGVAVSIMLVWRHGSSVRSTRAAERYRAMSDRYAAVSSFLRVVADGQPTAIATVDTEGHYTFANRKAAREAGISETEIVGKNIVNVLGPAQAGLFDPLNRQAHASGQPVFKTQTVHGPDGQRIVKSGHIPLAPDTQRGPEVLMVFEDITELVTERERRENTLRQLVGTIMGLIDRRDPFAALHSTRVGEVAEAIAHEMGLGEAEVETVEIAGSLMNLGKILVPKEVLTTTDTLSPEDLQNVRDAILMSADLLQSVDFDGPVIATIRAVQERSDGSGMPAGLKGEDILMTARVVAVANTFVGMVSVRAHRPGRSFDEAIDYLVSEVGKIFDRRPVAALVNILDNRDGRARWAPFGDSPPE